MTNNKQPANAKLRERIAAHIAKIDVGTRVRTQEMVTHLSTINRCYGLSNTRIGRLMGECDNLRWIASGVWERVEG